MSKQNTQTNADRIRAMSDEELAKIIEITIEDDICLYPSNGHCPSCIFSELCDIERGDALSWLRQPAIGGNNEAD